MDLLVELILIACLVGYGYCFMLWIKGHRLILEKKIQRKIKGFLRFMQREHVTKDIFSTAIKWVPIIAVMVNLYRGVMIAIVTGVFAFLVVGTVWIILDVLLYSLVIMVNVENEIITKLFLHMFISIAVAVLMIRLIAPDFHQWHIIAISVVLIASYVCNFMVMLRLLKMMKARERLPRHLWKVVVLIIVLFIIILAVAFYFASLVMPRGFNQGILTPLDCLYYTVITFATIGYGDIYPTHIITKGITIVTTITSILCLVVLVDITMAACSEQDQ